MIETWIPIWISFFSLTLSVLSLYVSWFTKNPNFHFEKIVPEKNYGVQRAIVTNDGFGEGVIYEDCGIAYHHWYHGVKTVYLKIPFMEFYDSCLAQNMYGSDSVKAWSDGGQLLKIDAKSSVVLPFDANILHQKLSNLNVRYIRFYAQVTSASPTRRTKVIFSKKLSVNDLKNVVSCQQVIMCSNEQENKTNDHKNKKEGSS